MALAGATVAARVSVPPTTSDAADLLSETPVTETTAGVTAISLVCVTSLPSLAVAVIVTVPAETPVTTPVEASTVARAVFLDMASRAKEYLLAHFYDREYGGIYWKLDAEGRPSDTKKQFYALGFAIYGLSEYHRATGEREALHYAKTLFADIETHSFNPVANGYLEATARDWSILGDVRLSDKDANEKFTMNTHLHILEAYTALYRMWKDEKLGRRLENLIRIFLDRIVSPETDHLGLFFDEGWNEKSRESYSCGHDIEASWLLMEAALVSGKAGLIEEVAVRTKAIAEAALEGYMSDGSMIGERLSDGTVDGERVWWVQAETVVGLWYRWRLHGDAEALQMAVKSWKYIKAHLIDRERGEWFWSIGADGRPNTRDDKAGFWKCPYHNGRMCMELAASENAKTGT